MQQNKRLYQMKLPYLHFFVIVFLSGVLTESIVFQLIYPELSGDIIYPIILWFITILWIMVAIRRLFKINLTD